jgi:adenine-specific DNA-methyltransferase
LVESKKLESSKNGTIYQLIEPGERTAALFSNWIGPRYNAGTFGANLLSDIIGRHNPFPYPKSIHTVGDAIFATGIDDGSYCLDFFAGSGTTGHAVINLNREDGGERKFILVEMGEYFDTVLLPRVKKVMFSPEWKDGKPQRQATDEEVERSPRIVKYLRMESYEDALDSIEFDQAAGDAQQKLAEPDDEYLLKYMLRWETKDSATLLNVGGLNTPFAYRLRAHVNGEKRERKVDLPETFNYLLGLNVHTRQACDDDGRRYLVYRGETRDAPGRTVAVIWRETAGWSEDDFARDRDFVAQHNLAGDADTVYVNSGSCIPSACAIEPMFKARMFAGVHT